MQNTTIEVTCNTCGKHLTIPQHKFNRKFNFFYCSKECFKNKPTKKETTTCETCRKQITRQRRSKESKHKYCSLECKKLDKDEKQNEPIKHRKTTTITTRTCDTCGKIFEESARQRKRTHAYCSRDCWKRRKIEQKTKHKESTTIRYNKSKKANIIKNLTRHKRRNTESIKHFEEHIECYMKEASAILRGKNTTNKNKCTKLAGED